MADGSFETNPASGHGRAIKLGQVHCVAAAAERGSFRRAAAALNLQQSTISRSVQALEDRLGVALFERRLTGVRLTPAGDRFLQDASVALEHLGQAAEAAARTAHLDRQVLRIGVAALPETGDLLALCDAAADAITSVRLHLEEARSGELLHRLKFGQIDIAIVLNPPSLAGCEILSLWTERLFLVSRTAGARADVSPLAWANLPEVALVAPAGEIGDIAIDHLSYSGIDAAAREVSIAGRDTALRLVALGRASAILSERALPSESEWTIRPLAGRPLSISAVRLIRNEKPVLRRFWRLAGARNVGAQVRSSAAISFCG